MMRHITEPLLAAMVLASVALPLRGQSPAALIAAGDAAGPFLHPDSALVFYRRALARDSGSYDALWKAARAIVDVAKQINGKDDSVKTRRDSMYLEARALAERAIRADSSRADGHFVLALALGRLSLTRGGRDRVRFGRIIYDEAARAIQIDPRHDGAHHILGSWHAEVRRLPGTSRFFAKVLFGGGFLGIASWDSARVHLETAVHLNPGYIYHRLDLAGVYLALDRKDDAVRELEAIERLPDGDVLDPEHRRRAGRLLEEIRSGQGR